MASLLSRLESYWKCVGKIKSYLGARTYKDIKSLEEDILDQWNNLDDHVEYI